ncbi:YaeQ family protein [Marinobacter sp. X15-166B]|uniref:YaeQ family protein n=1 Tax=Marinobacter sp. X15-166B TaxID=1897620 RepID=UPI00085C9211|nr:YaeQ family protein [Marinobacter sp. X15-166B]OEY66400.1 hypothetical protein BG841_07975 [Marinobacter sp. X15-166B]
MALKATIFKAELGIADLDRGYYHTHQLTLARHPSETDERLMLRLLAFALNASDTLEFCRGISTDDEPALWQKSQSDDIELWIELGLPDESRLRKACNRAQQVILYTYGGRAVPVWWDKIRTRLTRFNNLRVINLPTSQCEQLAGMAARTMQLQCTIQDGELSLGDHHQLTAVSPEPIYPAQ